MKELRARILGHPESLKKSEQFPINLVGLAQQVPEAFKPKAIKNMQDRLEQSRNFVELGSLEEKLLNNDMARLNRFRAEHPPYLFESINQQERAEPIKGAIREFLILKGITDEKNQRAVMTLFTQFAPGGRSLVNFATIMSAKILGGDYKIVPPRNQDGETGKVQIIKEDLSSKDSEDSLTVETSFPICSVKVDPDNGEELSERVQIGEIKLEERITFNSSPHPTYELLRFNFQIQPGLDLKKHPEVSEFIELLSKANAPEDVAAAPPVLERTPSEVAETTPLQSTVQDRSEAESPSALGETPHARGEVTLIPPTPLNPPPATAKMEEEKAPKGYEYIEDLKKNERFQYWFNLGKISHKEGHAAGAQIHELIAIADSYDSDSEIGRLLRNKVSPFIQILKYEHYQRGLILKIGKLHIESASLAAFIDRNVLSLEQLAALSPEAIRKVSAACTTFWGGSKPDVEALIKKLTPDQLEELYEDAILKLAKFYKENIPFRNMVDELGFARIDLTAKTIQDLKKEATDYGAKKQAQAQGARKIHRQKELLINKIETYLKNKHWIVDKDMEIAKIIATQVYQIDEDGNLKPFTYNGQTYHPTADQSKLAEFDRDAYVNSLSLEDIDIPIDLKDSRGAPHISVGDGKGRVSLTAVPSPQPTLYEGELSADALSDRVATDIVFSPYNGLERSEVYLNGKFYPDESDYLDKPEEERAAVCVTPTEMEKKIRVFLSDKGLDTRDQQNYFLNLITETNNPALQYGHRLDAIFRELNIPFLSVNWQGPTYLVTGDSVQNLAVEVRMPIECTSPWGTSLTAGEVLLIQKIDFDENNTKSPTYQLLTFEMSLDDRMQTDAQRHAVIEAIDEMQKTGILASAVADEGEAVLPTPSDTVRDATTTAPIQPGSTGLLGRSLGGMWADKGKGPAIPAPETTPKA